MSVESTLEDKTVKTPYVHLKQFYVQHLEIGLLSSLTLIAITLLIIPKSEPAQTTVKTPDIILQMTDIPQTLQKPLSIKGVPVKPVIPIAADIPDDMLSEENTDVNFGDEEGLLDIPAPPVPPGRGKGEYFPPKLMVSKFPEYPKELQDKGISGIIVLQVQIDVTGNVINHKVKQNTTNSALLEKLAVETVYKCHYNPASDGKNPIVAWTDHRFEFNGKTANN